METITVTIWIYVITIVFAMFIAGLIAGLGWAVSKMNLEKSDQMDISVPTADSLREQEMIAVAIAAAHARRNA